MKNEELRMKNYRFSFLVLRSSYWREACSQPVQRKRHGSVSSGEGPFVSEKRRECHHFSARRAGGSATTIARNLRLRRRQGALAGEEILYSLGPSPLQGAFRGSGIRPGVDAGFRDPT